MKANYVHVGYVKLALIDLVLFDIVSKFFVLALYIYLVVYANYYFFYLSTIKSTYFVASLTLLACLKEATFSDVHELHIFVVNIR